MFHFLPVITLLITNFSPQLQPLAAIFGHLYVFGFAYYSPANFFLQHHSKLDKLILSSVFSILATYPATVLTTIFEGQTGQAIFSPHLNHSLIIYTVLAILVSLFFKLITVSHLPLFTRPNITTKQDISSTIHFNSFKTLVLSLLIALFLSTINLNYADVYGDEYDLAYQAYNLVDGIKAGRKAYVVSFSGHPPLIMSAKHFSLNLLNPSGLDSLSDWQFRMSEVVFGLLTIISVYQLSLLVTSSKKAANISALILATNSYHLWLSQIFHREMLLCFFFVTTVLFAYKTKKSVSFWYLTAISFTAALLVKETAILLLPIILIILKNKYAIKISLLSLFLFTPVILYNIIAFKLTGYADVFFSNIFGVFRPGATPVDNLPLLTRITSEVTYLIDLLSPLTIAVSVLAIVYSLYKKQLLPLLLWILVVFSFFALTALRGYYMLLLVPPLVMVISQVLSKLDSRFFVNVTTLLLAYQTAYSLNTLVIREDLVNSFDPNVDGPVILGVSATQTHSQVALNWAYNWGYKQLVTRLQKTLKPNDCLIIDSSLKELAVRRYLWANDPIKNYYLGAYPTRFSMCKNSDLTNGVVVSTIPLPTLHQIGSVTDSHSTPQFLLYRP